MKWMGKHKGNRVDGKLKGNGQYGELLWNRMDEEIEKIMDAESEKE